MNETKMVMLKSEIRDKLARVQVLVGLYLTSNGWDKSEHEEEANAILKEVSDSFKFLGSEVQR